MKYIVSQNNKTIVNTNGLSFKINRMHTKALIHAFTFLNPNADNMELIGVYDDMESAIRALENLLMFLANESVENSFHMP